MSVMLGSVMKLRKTVATKQATPSPGTIATIAAWSGDDSAAGVVEPSPSVTLDAARPSLRNGARPQLKQLHSVSQAQEGRQHHKHHRHHRRHHRHHHHHKRERVDDQDAEAPRDEQEEDGKQSSSESGAESRDGGEPGLGVVSMSLANLDDIDAEASEIE